MLMFDACDVGYVVAYEGHGSKEHLNGSIFWAQ